MNPYCFVITSFGKKDNLNDLKDKFSSKKTDEKIMQINFDSIYDDLVKPAIIAAGMEPLIEREEANFGSIHKTMYEKILLCEFCIADLTNLNPNAYYELGMRYAVKPFSTIPIIASSYFPLPFDIGPNRTFAYTVDKDFNLSDKENDIKKLAAILLHAKGNHSTDSPLYDLVNGIYFQNSVDHDKTDVFRDKVIYDDKIKEELAYARTVKGDAATTNKQARVNAIKAIIDKYKPLENIETAILIDIMISFRNIEAFPEMKEYIETLPRYVFTTVMVQEQYAFVLNRNGGKANPVDTVMIDKAEAVLKALEDAGKASSETYGIWGRIYKDKFDKAYEKDKRAAKVPLQKACDIYQKGFESDIRDAYPGVNYVTCLELLGQKDQSLRLVPAVECAVKSKIKHKGDADYWDKATLLELSIIESKYDAAWDLFYEAEPLAKESWMMDTTLNNLQKILNYRKERGEDTTQLEPFIQKFSNPAG